MFVMSYGATQPPLFVVHSSTSTQ